MLAAALVVSVLALAAGAHAQQEPRAVGLAEVAEDVKGLCKAAGPIEAEKLKKAAKGDKVPPGLCKLEGRVLKDHGVGVTVPPPGQGVTGAGVGDPSAEVVPQDNQFGVETALDGTITMKFVGRGVPHELADEEGTQGAGAETTGLVTAASASDSECTVEYRDTQYHENDVQYWRFNPNSTDSSITGAQAIEAIRRGAYNMTYTYSDCSPNWGNEKYRATASYLGTTTLRSNLSGTTCGGSDGESTRDFGNLNNTYYLAWTCVFHNTVTREIQSTDMRFDSGNEWDGLDSGCSTASNQWDLVAVATHEWGHAFGVWHVGEDGAGKYLTMSPELTGPCITRERTLGRGDWMAWVDLYN
jgi:hypothetical protein